MALIRSELPRAQPSCLEKPRAAQCGKWLFGSATELLNVLDRLALPQSLSTRTRQLFRAGRDIQGKRGTTTSLTVHGTNTSEPREAQGRRRGARGAPDVRTPFAAALARVLTFPPIPNPHLPLTLLDPDAAVLHLFPLGFLLSTILTMKWALPPLPDRLRPDQPHGPPDESLLRTLGHSCFWFDPSVAGLQDWSPKSKQGGGLETEYEVGGGTGKEPLAAPRPFH